VISSPDPAVAGPQAAVGRVVRELERHVAADGWDAPVRLFALVRTGEALSRDPALAERLPPDLVSAARADTYHLTAVEQDGLPDASSLTQLLGRIAWPPTVDGAAIVVERVLLPPSAESLLPADAEQAAAAAASHPRREDVRLAVGVLRDGATACAARTRRNDDDERVAVSPELAPQLIAALSATLQD
jgi:hypothetical protein